MCLSVISRRHFSTGSRGSVTVTLLDMTPRPSFPTIACHATINFARVIAFGNDGREECRALLVMDKERLVGIFPNAITRAK